MQAEAAIEIALWVGTGVITAIGSLLALLLKSYLGRVATLEKKQIEDDKAHTAETTKLREDMAAELRRKDEKADQLVQRIFSQIDEVKKNANDGDRNTLNRIHDLEVTVTDFGRVYVPRSEYALDHKHKEIT